MLNTSMTMKPPRMLLNLQVASLSCSASGRSTPFQTILKYCFRGKLAVVSLIKHDQNL